MMTDAGRKLLFLISLLAVLLVVHCTREPVSNEGLRETLPRFSQLISLADSLRTQGDLDSCLIVLKQLNTFADTAGSEQDRAYTAGLLGEHYLYERGKVNVAQEYLLVQRDILESTPNQNTPDLIGNYLDLSFLHVKKLELPFAESYAHMASDLAESQEPADSIVMSNVCVALGQVSYRNLDHDTSIEYFHRAEQYLPVHHADSTLNNKILIGLINNFNNVLQTDSAIHYLDILHRRNTNNNEGLAEYERLSGVGRYLMDDYTQSANHLQKAIEYYQKQKTPNPFTSVEAFWVLSAAYQKDSIYVPALANVDSALIRKFGSAYDLDAFKSDVSSVSFFAARAEILADMGMAQKDTHLILRSLRLYHSVDTLRRHFVALDIDTYLHQQFYDNYYYWKRMEMFAFMFKETGSESWLRNMHDLITSYKAQGFNRDKILNHLYHSEDKEKPSFQHFIKNDLDLEEATLANNYHQINILLRERQAIFGEMSNEIPHVIEQLTTPLDISAADLLQYSSEHTRAVINYYIGSPYWNENNIYVLIAVNGRFKLQILKHSALILNQTDTLYTLHKIATAAPKTLDTLKYYTLSYDLYNSLFQNTWNQLEGVYDLLIIPDQKLRLLSFEGLVISNPQVNPGTNQDIVTRAHYLIEEAQISYAYSPNDLMSDDLRTLRNLPLDILAMAYSSKETINESSTGDTSELISSLQELEIIKTLYGSVHAKYFTGYDCTKSNFLNYADEASVIHVSTHGTFDSLDRSSGTLYLRKGRRIDKLYQHELRYKDIRPQLLVLSACDSGAGKLNNEEGMLSIGRTFQAFGAEEAITALWPLSGNASAEFFELFYHDLLTVNKAPTSLRNTKLKMLKDKQRYKLPGYWCSLVLHE